MKKLFLSLALFSLTAQTYAYDAVGRVVSAPAALSLELTDASGTGCQGEGLCEAFSGMTLVVLSYGVATTVALVILLKKDDVNAMIEKSEVTGEISPELASLAEQMRVQFSEQTGTDISTEEVLAQLQAQVI